MNRAKTSGEHSEMAVQIRECLQKYFGHSSFREGQELVIRALLDGRSALSVFPTGGGKSLCYQLPALLLPGLTLVVSPLIALMKDQVDALQSRGIKAARFDSTLSASEASEILGKIAAGDLKLLYVAPERLSSEAFLARLQRIQISLLAIDEAHCISEWGHNFRPEYLRIAAVAQRLGISRVLALTATATPQVAEEIRSSFRIAKSDHIQTSFHRPNLFLNITPALAAERKAMLVEKLREPGRFPAIVYVTLQRTCEEIAAYLQKAGFCVRAYHAGLADATRKKAQDLFMAGGCDIIVATIAFGMGIDKSGIRSVFHFNLPKSLENYQQEIGRAGRDGAPAHCEMLACADDLVVLENFILGDTPGKAALRQLVDSLLRQGSEFSISRYELSRSTDIRPLVLETVLTYLEKDDILEPLGSFYMGYRVGFQISEAQILAGYNPSRQHFLKKLFAAGKRGTHWLHIDVECIAKEISESPERIQKALRYLEETGDVVLQPNGLRHRFRLKNGAHKESSTAVAERLFALFQNREESDLKRLRMVVDFTESPGCLTQRLLSYFGEEMKHCWHCCRCAGADPESLPHTSSPELSSHDLQTLRNLAAESHAALRSPRALTRFVCGLSSPATTRDRLTKDDRFGFLNEVPFAEVLAQVESMKL